MVGELCRIAQKVSQSSGLARVKSMVRNMYDCVGCRKQQPDKAAGESSFFTSQATDFINDLINDLLREYELGIQHS